MQQTPSSNQTSRLKYLDGFKGIACLMIMLCHYIGIVKYSADISCFPMIDRISGSFFSMLISEGYWLQLFFVISGFLLSCSKISRLKDLIIKIIKRFFRFYLPILAACVIILVIAKVIGFHNSATAKVFTCDWFQAFYRDGISAADLITDPINTIIGDGSKFNPPYWVIKDMFYSSILIYAVNFLSSKTHNSIFRILIYVAVTIVSMAKLGSVYFACMMGALCGILSQNTGLIDRIPVKINSMLCLLCILLPFGLHTVLFRLLARLCNAVVFMQPILKHAEFRSVTWGVLYYSLLILFVGRNKKIQTFLSGKLLCTLNEWSFGIYSFHWPLLSSIGALLMITLPVKPGILIGWVVCIALTLIISAFYHILIEKNINTLLKRI